MQLTITVLRNFFLSRFFSDMSLTFRKIPDISLTAVKFPHTARFPREVVTL